MRRSLFALVVLLLPICAEAQTTGRSQWVLEPQTESLDVEGGSGPSYLDPSSIHRGTDGLVYFHESSDVDDPADAGKVGLMNDAYDCARNIKYMCVDLGDWRNDPKGRVDASRDPALPVYRKYLCGDDSSNAPR